MLRRGVRAGAAAGVGRRVSARGAKLPATLPPLVASSPRGNCWPLRGCGGKIQRFPGNERRYVSENCPVVRETPSPLRQLFNHGPQPAGGGQPTIVAILVRCSCMALCARKPPILVT